MPARLPQSSIRRRLLNAQATAVNIAMTNFRDKVTCLDDVPRLRLIHLTAYLTYALTLSQSQFLASEATGLPEVRHERILNCLKNIVPSADESDCDYLISQLCIHDSDINFFDNSLTCRAQTFFKIDSCAGILPVLVNGCITPIYIDVARELSGGNLIGAKLDRKGVEEAIDKRITDLSGVDLSDMDLTGLDLRGVDLRNASLTRANLRGVDLTGADLTGIDLTNANLTRAKLDRSGVLAMIASRRTDLKGMNLRGADLTRADLKGIDLTGIDLKWINFRDADLTDTKVDSWGIRDILSSGRKDLRGVNMSGVNLERVDLTGTDLTDANLTNARLGRSGVIAILAVGRKDLNGTDISGVNLEGVDLTGVVAENIAMPESVDDDSLDQWFNHINNYGSGSLLTTINSINNTVLKIDLMHQVIDWFKQKNVDITSIIEPLKDILFQEPIYLRDAKILEFIINKIFAKILTEANSQAIRLTIPEISTYIGIIESYDSKQQQQFMLARNTFFIQLVYNCLVSETPTIVNRGKRLYMSYLTQFRAIMDTSRMEFEDGTEDLGLDRSLLFVSIDHPGTALIVSCKYLKKFLYSETIDETEANGGLLSWNHLCFVLKTSDEEYKVVPNCAIKLDEIFRIFKIFQAKYTFWGAKSKFIRLLNILQLSKYHKLFTDAINVRYMNEKLISVDDADNLRTIFSKVITQTEGAYPTLVETHASDIMEAFEITTKTPSEQAKTFLCLAGVFAKYSSSSIFGTETDSPESLRYYAYALMNKANSLDPSIFRGQFTSWQNVLLGMNGAFSCTAILSSTALLHCNLNFKDIANGIIPAAWS